MRPCRLPSRFKIFAYLFLPLAVLVLLIGFATTRHQQKDHLDSLKRHERDLVAFEKRLFEASLTSSFSDALILSRVISHHLHRSDEMGDFKADLADLFLSFAQNRKSYTRISYLDRLGRERVRVVFARRSARLVPSWEYENDSPEPDEELPGPGRGISLIGFGLNPGTDHTEESFAPLLHIAIPISDAGGELVLHFLGTDLFDQLDKISQQSTGDLFLINDRGTWQIRSRQQGGWQLRFEESPLPIPSLLDPEVAEQLIRAPAGQFSGKRGLLTYASIVPASLIGAFEGEEISPGLARRSWKVVSIVSPEALAPPWRNRHSLMMAATFVLLLLLTWQLAGAQQRRQEVIDSLTANEKKLDTITNSVQEAIIMIDGEGKTKYWNAAAQRIFGYTPEEIRDRDIHSLIAPGNVRPDAERALEIFARTGESNLQGTINSITARRKDGSVFPAELTLSSVQIDDRWWAVGTVRDITERKRFEEALKNSETQLRLFVKHTPAAVAMFDKDLCYILASDRWYRDYNLAGREIIGRHHYDIFPEIADMEQWQEIHRRCLAGAVEKKEEDPFLREDGKTEWLRWEVHPWRDNTGEVGGIVMFTEVITDRIIAKQHLKRAKDKAQLYLDVAGNIFVVLDRQGRIEMINQKGCEVLGYEEKEIVGRDWFDLALPEENRQEVNMIFTEIMNDNLNPFEYVESEVVTRGGERRLIAWRNSMIRNEDGTIVSSLSSGEDITERKRVEAELRQLNEELENRVRQRTLELEHANQAITASERRSQLLKEVASAANAAASPEEALKIALESICRFTHWPLGHVYRPADDDSDLLEPTTLWYSGDEKRFKKFQEITEKTWFAPGIGLPGRILAARKPVWVENIMKDTNFPRAKFLGNLDLRSGFGFPVIADGQVAAVLEFFSTRIEKPDESILSLIDKVGVQLGFVMERKRVELALTESERKARAIFDQSFQFMGLLSIDGRILQANRTALVLAGVTEDQVAGMLVWESPWWNHSPEMQDQIRTAVQHAASGGLVRLETRHVDPGGRTLDVDFSLKAVHNEKEEPVYLIAEGRDITDRKRAEAEVKKLALVAQKTDNGVIITDRKGLVEWVNDGFTRITGFTLADCLGKKPGQLLQGPDTDMDTVESMRRAVSEGRGIKTEVVNYAKNGRRYWVEIDIQPIFDEEGRLQKFIAIENDITERKDFARELEAAKNAAEQASRVKGEFLANMSHEIRTPMNAIIGMAHLLAGTELSPKQSDYLDNIKTSGHALLAIINDILDFSKIEAGMLGVEKIPLELDKILKTLSDMLAVKAHEKGLELLFHTAPDIPGVLIGDPLRISQILTNLVGNAIKFTAQGEVVLSIEQTETEREKVTILFSVRDTGIGLTRGQIDRLFQEFSQADSSTTRKFGGTGLGLAICKHLVTLMGGRIWVESEPGRGSTFFFTVPFGVETAGQPAKLLPDPDLRDMRVLVVDDNPTFQDIMRDILESFTFRPVMASSAEEALERLEEADTGNDPFRLVLMDWKMPGMDGFEATRRIKSHPLFARTTTIIMITAYGREEVIHRAEQIGLDGFLIKPVNRSLVFDTIMHAFGQAPADRPVASRELPGRADIRRELNGHHVLLVEDNRINQDVARELLESAGLLVTLAENGEEAVRAAATGDFAAILMDIQMPVLDGFEATRRIRRLPGSRGQLPIIAMTANVMAGDRDKAVAAGMNDQVDKPISPENLYGTLSRWIEPDACPQPASPPPTAQPGRPLPRGMTLNRENGLNRLGGNLQTYDKVLKAFARDKRHFTAGIRAAIGEERSVDAHRMAHTLKGLAGTIGAEKLAVSARKLEMSLKEGGDASVEETLQRTEQCLGEVLAEIEKNDIAEAPAARQDKPAPAPSSSDLDRSLGPQLDILEKKLKNDDYGAMSELDTLLGNIRNSVHEEDVLQIKAYIGRYDYASALTVLDRLRHKLCLCHLKR